ncbi:methyl-accepting chemotaxis protein [Domibacillus sp. PGB-M46]|uniref:methyl-accepting chemotaxis protein n=1 Tax=Domibacillus sp. PGB-M46 TaxID=2910255 RepID=UPI001F59F39D|nr:HAMP domain-containing methyl-accepting chemotaxis protein [Domibacillus sp. PGB-M46]MCI2255545.1 methyl-accepting chemotaxis protein [Domibacillus sp. PGB-M46]
MFSSLKWENIRIGWKYGIAFGITLLLFVISVLIVFFQLEDVSHSIDDVDKEATRSVDFTLMASTIRGKDIRIADYIYLQDENSINEFKDRMEQVTELETKLEPQLSTDKQKELFETVKANNQEINQLFLEQIVPAIEKKEHQKVRELRIQTQGLLDSTVEDLTEVRTASYEERVRAIKSANNALHNSVIILIVSIIASILLGSFLIIIVSRMIIKNLKKVVSLATQVSEGNLSADNLDYKGNDEIGQLSTAVNKMSSNLRNMVNEMVRVSDSVSSQSEELSQSSKEVQQGSEQIASTVQELAAGAEQQASSVGSISEVVTSQNEDIKSARTSGEQIEQKSSGVLRLTEDGVALMKNSMNQMNMIDGIVKESVEKVNGLAKRSLDISKLVDVIQNVANQTNLLALNAAIEAARAGEHGKGFAVVADEVRNLAEQVSASVGEITQIVGNIQLESRTVTGILEEGYDQVRNGIEQVNLSGAKFNEINEAVQIMGNEISAISTVLQRVSNNSITVSQSVENIASISEEAAAGLEQTSASVQQSNSSMEEVSASADLLAQHAETLNDLVRKFKL